MLHLGDITKINGGSAPAVDVVIGGSPCQDLSIAGKRAGLAGARSGLYMEQIRVIKEMREHDKRMGRTGELIRPRYMVWENVPGAFSSNGGKDFAAVLEEAIRVAEPEAPDIEVPEKGWNTWGGYHDEVGGRWSVAWRVLDAQHWGVPQRRRRIALIADFGGDTAWEISFEQQSVCWDTEESGAAGEGPAGDSESGAAYAVRIRGGCDGGGKGALVQTEKSRTLGTGNDQTLFCMATQQGGAEVRSDDRAPTLTASAGMSGNNQPVICLQGNAIDRADTAGCNEKGWKEDVCYTLNTIDRPAVCAGFKLGNSEKARSIGYAEEQSPTLNAECGGNKPAVMCLNDQGGNVMDVSHEVSGTLRAQEHGHQPAVIAFAQNQREEVRDVGGKAVSLAAEAGMHCQTFVALDMSHACDVIRDCGEVAPSLQARMGTGGNQIPLTYQKTTGTLSPGAHAGSYNGQDAYNDMLVCGVYCPEKAHAVIHDENAAVVLFPGQHQQFEPDHNDAVGARHGLDHQNLFIVENVRCDLDPLHITCHGLLRFSLTHDLAHIRQIIPVGLFAPTLNEGTQITHFFVFCTFAPANKPRVFFLRTNNLHRQTLLNLRHVVIALVLLRLLPWGSQALHAVKCICLTAATVCGLRVFLCLLRRLLCR